MLAQDIFKADHDLLQAAERCLPRNFPESIDLDSNILGCVFVNNIVELYFHLKHDLF